MSRPRSGNSSISNPQWHYSSAAVICQQNFRIASSDPICVEKSGSECGAEEEGGGGQRAEGLSAAEAGQFSGRRRKLGNSST